MELKIAKIWKDATNVYLKMKTTQTQQTNKITSENRNKHKQILQLVEVQPKGTTTIRHLKLCVWEMWSPITFLKVRALNVEYLLYCQYFG